MDLFTKEIINKFKNIYSINLDEGNEITIDNMLFPNYCNWKILNLNYENDYRDFEYCRIINKIFGVGYIENQLSYYEIPEVKIDKNDIVFDCGANTGIFSLYASYKGAKVYGFEPGTLIRHYLKNTKNYNKNINIVPFGVSNENKKEIFFQTDNPGASRTKNFAIPPYHRILYKENIKLITIDSFVKQTNIIPTFIKMDIENGEIAALEGAKETIKNFYPKCAISIHDENLQKISYIKSLFPTDYKFYMRPKNEKFYDPILFCYKEK